MVDWAYVNGMAEEYGMGDPDMDVHDPAGHCGGGGGGGGQHRYNAAYHAGFETTRDTHVRCKFCKQSAWWKYKDGWKLHNVDSTLHQCRITSASPDEFEDIS